VRTSKASEDAAMAGELVLEFATTAAVTRFLSEDDAQRFARRSDGLWNHVLGPVRSFALGSIPSWVVVVWEW